MPRAAGRSRSTAAPPCCTGSLIVHLLAGLVLGEYRRTATDDTAPRLTPRETEVLRLLAKG